MCPSFSEFGTVALGAGDWLRCAAVASLVLWLRELGKIVARATSGGRRPVISAARHP